MARQRKDKEERLSRKQRRANQRAALAEESMAALPSTGRAGSPEAQLEKNTVRDSAHPEARRPDSSPLPKAEGGNALSAPPSWYYLLLIPLMGMVVASYSNTMHSPFLLDDIGYVASDKLKRLTDLSFPSLLEAGFSDGSKTRWLVNISFALNRYFTGIEKWGFHLTNLVIHLCSILVVYLLSVTTLTLPRLGYTRRQAMLIGVLAAGLWGANPVQTNAVTYIVQRMTSMAALFFMASLLCYVRARMAGKHRTLLFAAAVALGFLAFGCKEISAMLPISILAYELYFFRNTERGLSNKTLLVIATLVIVLPILLAFASTGGNFLSWITKEYSRYNFTLGERLLTEPRVVLFYLSLFFMPLPSRLNLLHDFSVSHSLLDPVQTSLALIALLALVVAGGISFKRHRLLSFAIFWYLANLVIESSFIALDLIFEHRLYLPTVFLSIFLAAAIYKLLKARTLPFMITGLVCVVVLSSLTWQRNQAFASAVSFWSDVARKSPQLADGYQGLYTALRAEGRRQEARDNLLRAFELDPAHAQTAYDLAALYRDEGSSLKAIEVLKKSLAPLKALGTQALTTNFILNNIQLRGDLYLKTDKFAEAKNDYEFFMRYTDDNPDVLVNLSIAQRETGEPQKAIQTLQRLPELLKKSAIFYVNLGQAYDKDGQVERAIQTYQQGLQLDPEYSELHFNLGLAYIKKGMKAEGEQAMRKGIILRTQPQKTPADPHAFLKK